MQKILIILASLLFSSISTAITPKLGTINSHAYILVAHPHLKVIDQNNANQRIVPASLTKILTAYIIFDQIKKNLIMLKDEVIISQNAMKTKGSRSFLETNQSFSINTLLKGLIIQSGNDAAKALAEHLAGSEALFGSLMNEYAKAIGMQNSHFVNASGLPHPDHYSTAYDLALLSSKLISNFPEFYKYYRQKSFEINGIKQFNRNGLLSKNKHIDGIKTGYTQASQYSLAASINENNNRFISIVIGAKSRKIREFETLKILNFANHFFENTLITPPNESIATIPLYYSDKKQIPVGTAKAVYITTSRLDKQNVQTTLKINKKLFAPINQGQQVGEMTIILGEKVIKTVPIITLESAEKGGWFQQIIDTIRTWL